jgi:hypothetical protein
MHRMDPETRRQQAAEVVYALCESLEQAPDKAKYD